MLEKLIIDRMLDLYKESQHLCFMSIEEWKISLTQIEREQIKEYLGGKRITQRVLAANLGVTEASLSKTLHGTRSLKAEEGRRMYDLLEKPPELKFLLGPQSDNKSGNETDMFQCMYDHYSFRLRQIYTNPSCEHRATILAGLEELINLYKGKQSQ